VSEKVIKSKSQLEQKCSELTELLRKNSNAGDEIEDIYMQELIDQIIKLYAQKTSNSDYDLKEGPKSIPPITGRGQLTVTEVATFADKLLQAGDIDIFELQIWRSMGSGY
jgi:hypothetical protein